VKKSCFCWEKFFNKKMSEYIESFHYEAMSLVASVASGAPVPGTGSVAAPAG
jgi:hypothetical protein